jgi:hypothetical protein
MPATDEATLITLWQRDLATTASIQPPGVRATPQCRPPESRGEGTFATQAALRGPPPLPAAGCATARQGLRFRVHSDLISNGLSYGPSDPSKVAPRVSLEQGGTRGHSAVRRGEYQYVLPFAGAAKEDVSPMNTPDYDTDFYAWTEAQAAALRHKNWAALDVEQLAEEIADVGHSVRFAIESQLTRLLLHLLKLGDDPATRPRRGWQVTVADAREEIAKRATGSVRHHPESYLPEAYRQARRRAALATGRPPTTFPETCPWTLDQVLDADFWPEAGW